MSNKKESVTKDLKNLLAQLSPEEQFAFCFSHMTLACKEQKWGDPMSYARSKEILAAHALGHKVSDTLSGADAYNKAGHPVEYKSTTGARMNMFYSGISVHDTWSQQEKYLKEQKILPYPEHYANRFDDEGNLVESWKLTGEVVYNLLLPKLRKNWENRSNRKDPRLAANLSQKEIKLYGTRVI